MDFADRGVSQMGSVSQMEWVRPTVKDYPRPPSPSASSGLDCAFLWKNGRLNCEFSLASSLNKFFFYPKFSSNLFF